MQQKLLFTPKCPLEWNSLAHLLKCGQGSCQAGVTLKYIKGVMKCIKGSGGAEA